MNTWKKPRGLVVWSVLFLVLSLVFTGISGANSSFQQQLDSLQVSIQGMDMLSAQQQATLFEELSNALISYKADDENFVLNLDAIGRVISLCVSVGEVEKIAGIASSAAVVVYNGVPVDEIERIISELFTGGTSAQVVGNVLSVLAKSSMYVISNTKATYADADESTLQQELNKALSGILALADDLTSFVNQAIDYGIDPQRLEEITGDMANVITSTLPEGTDKAQAALLMERAKAYFSIGEYDLAISNFEQAKNLDAALTENADKGIAASIARSYASKALAALDAGDYETAIVFFDIAISYDSTIASEYAMQIAAAEARRVAAQRVYLTVIVDGNQGTVSIAPDKDEYTLGETITLTAKAANGWKFKEWIGDVADTASATTTVVMNANKTVAAIFEQEEEEQYTLTVTVNEGEGSVEKSPDEATYTYGEVVALTATAADGWKFKEWTGDVAGTDTTIEITMDGNKAVTAVFEQEQYTLTVTVNEGEGSVAKSPDQTTYTYGEVVALTATAADGWKFKEWTGDVAGTDTTIQITMDGNKAVAAVFEQEQYTLTVTVNETEGTVVKSPDQATYTLGTEVTLTASAEPGWRFKEWTGDATGTDITVKITIDGNKAVTAVFIDLVTLGEQAYNAGNWEDAVSYFEIALDEIGEGALGEKGVLLGDSYAKLGMSAYGLDLFSEAIVYFENALKWLPSGYEQSQDELLSCLAASYLALDRLEDAITALEALRDIGLPIEQLAEDWDVFYELARLYAMVERYDHATAMIEVQIGLVPDDGEAYILASQIGVLRGEYEYVIDVVRRGVELELGLADLYKELLDAYVADYGADPQDLDIVIGQIISMVEEEFETNVGLTEDAYDAIEASFVAKAQSEASDLGIDLEVLSPILDEAIDKMMSAVENWLIYRGTFTEFREELAQIIADFEDVLDSTEGIDSADAVNTWFAGLEGLLISAIDEYDDNGTKVSRYLGDWDAFLQGLPGKFDEIDKLKITPEQAMTTYLADAIQVMLQPENFSKIVRSFAVLTDSEDGVTFAQIKDAYDAAMLNIRTAAEAKGFTEENIDVMMRALAAKFQAENPEFATYSDLEILYELSTRFEAVYLPALKEAGAELDQPIDETSLVEFLDAIPGAVSTAMNDNGLTDEKVSSIVLEIRKIFFGEEVPVTYTLTMKTTGSGTVVPAVGSHEYEEGKQTAITATPDQGWRFKEWIGDVADTTSATTTVVMNADKTVTAVFEQEQYTLTVTVNETEGTVVKSPDQATYTLGTEVTLTASAEPGWRFKEWTGDATGTDITVKITIDGNKAVTAVFVDLVTLGEQAYNAGNWEDAVSYFETALDELGDNALGEKGILLGDSYAKLGMSAYGLGLFSEAIVYFENALEWLPSGYEQSQDELLSCLAASYLALDRLEDAITALEALRDIGLPIEQLAEDWDVFYELARLYVMVERYDDAKEAIEAQIAVDPEDAQAYIRASQIGVLRGEYEYVIDVVRRGVELELGLADLYKELLDAYVADYGADPQDLDIVIGQIISMVEEEFETNVGLTEDAYDAIEASFVAKAQSEASDLGIDLEVLSPILDEAIDKMMSAVENWLIYRGTFTEFREELAQIIADFEDVLDSTEGIDSADAVNTWFAGLEGLLISAIDEYDDNGTKVSRYLGDWDAFLQGLPGKFDEIDKLKITPEQAMTTYLADAIQVMLQPENFSKIVRSFAVLTDSEDGVTFAQIKDAYDAAMLNIRTAAEAKGFTEENIDVMMRALAAKFQAENPEFATYSDLEILYELSTRFEAVYLPALKEAGAGLDQPIDETSLVEFLDAVPGAVSTAMNDNGLTDEKVSSIVDQISEILFVTN